MRGAAEYTLASGIFVRGVGAVYALAFGSLAVQALGLYGSLGILPVTELLALARERLGDGAPLAMPSVFWLHAGDAVLVASCWAGVVLGVALAGGIAPRLCAALLWVLYLSWVHVGRVFLGFQWDALLLETGLLAIWLAPSGLRVALARTPVPPAAPLWLLRWLVLRLFLLSGLVKILSGDPAWRDLSAMAFHHWTQPLPNPIAPFAHALPGWAHAGETLATFAIELGLPLLVLAPPPLRRIAAAGFLALLVAINATGNYGFFSPLAVVLCIPLIDDALWRRLPGLRSLPEQPPRAKTGAVRRALAIAATAIVLLATAGHALGRLSVRLPSAWHALLEAVQPLRSFHAYGLFAVMTKDRLEIAIEGSEDGTTWHAYEFRWKPDRVEDPPAFVPFHMPRLDWQMWFAALGDCASNPWLLAFQQRLLEASPDALALLAHDPFAGRAPERLRTTIARYHFARPGDRATRLSLPDHVRGAPGDWWLRDPLGRYCPVLELVDGRLRAAR